jgi:Fe2+ transport system protein FeoA
VLPFRQARGVRKVRVLSELNVGESGILVALDLPESVQNHLMHMGFVPNALVTTLRRAPAGDPTVYGVDGMEIALGTKPRRHSRRNADASKGKIKHRRGHPMSSSCARPAFQPSTRHLQVRCGRWS